MAVLSPCLEISNPEISIPGTSLEISYNKNPLPHPTSNIFDSFVSLNIEEAAGKLIKELKLVLNGRQFQAFELLFIKNMTENLLNNYHKEFLLGEWQNLMN